jgi:hypothetical protein
VYATVFSGFYDVFMLLLFALIFRAVAIEFRGQLPQKRWRATWDVAFAISSATSALLIGVAMGNIVGYPAQRPLRFSRQFPHPAASLLTVRGHYNGGAFCHAHQSLLDPKNGRTTPTAAHRMDKVHGATLSHLLRGVERIHHS